MEGASDRPVSVPFHEANGKRWSRRLSERTSRERGLGGRDRSVSGSVDGLAREENARDNESDSARQSDPGRREAHEVPGSSLSEPKLRETSTQRELRSEPGTSEVRVHVLFRVADVGPSHRAFSPPGGCKTSRRCKDASLKEAHPPSDTGRERREGEPVRAQSSSDQDLHCAARGFRLTRS